MTLSAQGPQVWALALVCCLWVLEHRNRISDPQLLFQNGMELGLRGAGGGERSPCGKAFCGLLALLFLQKLSLAVPALSSSGWDLLTRMTWKSGHIPRKPAASSSVPEAALLWPQGSAPAPRAGGLLYTGRLGGHASFQECSLFIEVRGRVGPTRGRVPLPHQNRTPSSWASVWGEATAGFQEGAWPTGPMGRWRPICGGKRGDSRQPP